MNLYIPARPPFNLYSVIHSHGWVQLAPFRELEGRTGFDYTIRLDSGQVLDFSVEEAAGGVNVTPRAALEEDSIHELVDRVDWMLGLGLDFSAFYLHAATEPKLARAAKQAQGRVLRSASLFEDVIKTILTTNTLWGGTKRMVRSLVDLYGEAVPGSPELKAFPTPERLAQANPEELKDQARLGYRAPYVFELARAVSSGDFNLEALKFSEMPTLELRKQLMAIKGVGGYAAANLLMLLGRYDFIPIDSWALKMVSQEWHGGGPVTQADVEAAFARWDGFKGLAYWFWDWDNQG